MLKAPIKGALVMATASSLLLFGYEIVRSASYTLFKAAYGVSALPLTLALLPLFLLPLLLVYNQALLRLGPRATLVGSAVLSALAIAGCYLSLWQGSRVAPALLLLVQETYAVLLVEQFWSYINSSLNQSEAKKYNGLILTISTVGAIAGGACAHLLAERLGTAPLLLVAVAASVPVVVLIRQAYRLHAPPAQGATPAASTAAERGRHELLGLGMLRRYPILALLLAMVAASQVYGAMLGLNFQTWLETGYPQADRQTAVSGLFFASLNTCSILLQLVLSPWLLTHVRPAAVLTVIPLLHAGLMIVCFLTPGFPSVALAFLAFKALDYSLFRAAKEILYIPLPFDARYRTKELIDVFGYRFSKSGASLAISLAQKAGLVLNGFLYACLGLAAAVTWFVCLLPLLWQERSTKSGLQRSAPADPV